jgi:hypothetical protein
MAGIRAKKEHLLALRVTRPRGALQRQRPRMSGGESAAVAIGLPQRELCLPSSALRNSALAVVAIPSNGLAASIPEALIGLMADEYH